MGIAAILQLIAQLAPVVTDIVGRVQNHSGKDVSSLTDADVVAYFKSLDVGDSAAENAKGMADAAAGIQPTPSGN